MKKKIYTLLGIVIIFACAFVIQRNIADSKAIHFDPQQLTVMEALHAGMLEAQKWDSGAVPLYLTSVDDELGKKSGQDGRRRRWNLQVSTPDHKRAVVSIRDGIVEKVYPGVGPYIPEMVVSSEEINIDSPQLVIKSKQERNLLPGIDWANGYHFVLQVLNGQSTITVVGLDNSTKLQQIIYDSSSGEIMN
ncbi:hypothetical protein LQV63_23670 [Paenibacillus profundus]|uniref:Uncharacterized protein n=1 Tax=Paenibacillus profundus TaxID=1173085 RepID=A0ABS8YPP8_9BACL|nr:hypothetical protein [Paenibacillus profundus]MCE5172282.1 hypothetical protein [Paenibacillus profundus]